MANLLIAVEGVVSVARHAESHLFAVEFDLEMLLLCLLSRRAETFKHLDDVPPVNVVCGRMREKLPENLLGMWHALIVYRHAECEPIQTRAAMLCSAAAAILKR